MIPAHELPLLEPYAVAGVRVLEFGNKRNPSGLYRTWYVARGCNYTCVDVNARDGAVPLDVRKPFDLGRFGLVTNFGFSEHVSVQRPFWKNAHAALAVGGVFVGTTPKPREWVSHAWSYWHPSREFYGAWAAANGMDIVTLTDCGPPHRGLQSMIGYVLRKVADVPHTWATEFDSLIWRNREHEIPTDGRVHC